jgi:nicotinamidase-related amidase
MTGKGATVMLPLHLQNEVIHPDGQIHAGFGGPDDDRLAFVSAASAALRTAVEAGVQRVFVRMAFQPGGADLPDNCELYQSVKHNEVMREGSWGAEFFGALAPDAATDIIVSHNRVNAFFATDLEKILSDCDCDHVVLFGVATHSVVEHTARHAADLGLKVTLVEDACSAFPRDRHTASLSAIKNLVTVVPSRELALGGS